MNRSVLVYVLLPVVILAAAGLAYNGYRSSTELASFERHIMLDTLRELAEEKVFGIESEIIKVETDVFDTIDLSNLPELQKLFSGKPLPVESVRVLDQDGEIVPGGFFTTNPRDAAESRELFEEKILPELALGAAPFSSRFHVHTVIEGRPYLFGVLRRFERAKLYYIVVEADLTYLVGSVFPQFFDVRSPRLYQVVDESGNIIYGYSFAGIDPADVVARRFPETLTKWRLRVAQREASNLASQSEQQATFDLILISMALVVIIAGIGFIFWAMRRERRLNQLKSDFISNVSHELKTPLSIISMFGELLAMGRSKGAEQTAEYAEIIRRESVRLSRLIDNVLDFAKIERGVDVYEFASDDLGEVVHRALEICAHRLDSAQMTLEVDIAEDLPPARIDANAMTLAVLNLVDNAIKYAVAGGKLIVRVVAAGDDLVLEVCDFGPGIAVDERQQVFERFYRSRDVRLKPIRGSGIGLALVQHIAVAHHGSVKVTDNEACSSGGCCFRITIPSADV